MLVSERHGLEVLHKALWVVVEYHAAVERVFGVKQPFHLLHHLKCLAAPFLFHKRSHVAPSAVLRLERTVIFVNHELHYVAHQPLVALHFGVGVK